MNTELIVFKYDTDASFEFQDTYLAASAYGTKLGLEFSGDITNTLYVGQTITIDKTNKSINPWIDGVTTIIAIEPSSVYPPPGNLVFTNTNLVSPTFTTNENGIIKFSGQNLAYEFYESLDVKDDGAFPLTFSIADIRNPDKRNSTFSKTITLPGTKKNNQFFGSIFEVGIDGTYDVTKKVQAVVYQQGLEQLNGVLQLKKIIRDDFNNISYEIVLFGQLANIFYNLGETKLCDLDFSEYDHVYTYSSITESWNTSIRKNGNQFINFETGYTTTFTDTEFLEGKVVLITSGAHSFNIGDTVWIEKNDNTINPEYNGMSTIIQIPASNKIMINKFWGESSVLESGTVYIKNTIGDGYVYPFLEYGDNSLVINAVNTGQTTFYPSIYTKTIIDKIFQKANFTYNSDFFESPYFKRLIVPYTGQFYLKSTEQIQLQEFRAGLTGGTQSIQFQWSASDIPVSNYINLNCDVSGTTTPDCYDNLAISTGGASQNYLPNLNTGTLYPSGRFTSNFYTSQTFEANINYKLRIQRLSGQALNLATGLNGGNSYLKVQINMYKKDGTTGVFTNIGSASNLIRLNFIITSVTGYITPLYNLRATSILVNLKPGDQVFPEVEVSLVNPSGGEASATQINVLNFTTDMFVDIKESSRFLNVPDNVLYFNNEVSLNNLLPCDIKCSDFLMGLVKLFNLYIDDEKGITNRLRIEPRDDYYGKGELVEWTNKLDISKSIDITPLSELTTKDFEFTYKADVDYWNKRYTDSTTQVYTYRKISTDNDFLKGTNKIETLFSPTPQVEYANTGLSLGQIKKEEFGSGENVKSNNTKANIRILYYSGLKTYKSYNSANTNVKQFIFNGAASKYYPYAGMEDDGYISYYSLGYGVPIISFYYREAFSNGGLYNRYWSRYLFEIGNKNSKSVSCNIYLTPEDIFKLDFRNTFYINGVYYRLNKISDYNPLNNETTKCEFIKVEDSKSFVTQIKDVTNGFDDTFDTGEDNIINNLLLLNKGQSQVTGFYNNISNESYNVLVNGNNNNILQNSNNVSIIGGDNNTIIGSLDNVSIIGTNNVTVSNSNTTVVNGSIFRNGILLPSLNVNDAGLDMVYNLTSSLITNVWDAGKDVVIDIGSNQVNNTLDGSLDITYEV